MTPERNITDNFRISLKPGYASICESCPYYSDIFEQLCGWEFDNAKPFEDNNGIQHCSHSKNTFDVFSKDRK
ncbi:MAG: hypothetical protein V1697_02580 [Candidatus Levyibacteriota bacterium]